MADPLLCTFSPALRRLILCGGGGLGAIWGPVVRASDGVWTWNPLIQRAIRPATIEQPALLSEPDGWTLSLEHWRARLAKVAAWMLNEEPFAMWVISDRGTAIHLAGMESRANYDRFVYAWPAKNVNDFELHVPHDGRRVVLPTLPRHLLTHDPHTALILALYDVPEIRARVEALYA